ncbi:MAG TPA: F0F1 ATP synthase subunit beta, partial [Mycobacterium sp.]|nr:F0F1 ATP synthase subunit beta [Mycobacterium sp.]
MPDIYNALLIDIDTGADDTGEGSRTIYAEVALHIGDNMVRAVSLKPTDGMRRGSRAVDTGGPISVPV